MAAQFALSWDRPKSVALQLNKPWGRAVSKYRTTKYKVVEETAIHINNLNPEMSCAVEVFLDVR